LRGFGFSQANAAITCWLRRDGPGVAVILGVAVVVSAEEMRCDAPPLAGGHWTVAATQSAVLLPDFTDGVKFVVHGEPLVLALVARY
jgi:hypothetical protein